MRNKVDNFGANLTMLLSSIISLGASLVLAIETLRLAEDANAKLGCNISAVISCGKVSTSWQSNLLGFPNPFLGLICEPVVITVAIAGLMGVVFPKLFLKVATFIYFLGFIFAIWLFSQSYFVIGAFCPWCLLVTFSTITVFSSMLKLNIRFNAFNFSEETNLKLNKFYDRGLDLATLSVLYGSLIFAVVAKYHAALF